MLCLFVFLPWPQLWPRPSPTRRSFCLPIRSRTAQLASSSSHLEGSRIRACWWGSILSQTLLASRRRRPISVIRPARYSTRRAGATAYLVTVSLLLPGTPSLLLPADVIWAGMGSLESLATAACPKPVTAAFSKSRSPSRPTTSRAGPLSIRSRILQGLYFQYLATFGGEPTFALSIMDGGNPLTFSPVPEPATWGLMAIGFVSLGAFAMRRRAKAEAA